MRRRVAYGRVSTQQQADQGALEHQERSLLAACGADEVLLDVGSGKTTARPGYQQLIELIASGQVEQVLVADQDRLNRNLQADLELWSLCDANDTRITDLNGREIEFRSPDGELLSTVVSALNQHRSRAYGAKTRRGLEQARQQGLPARPRVCFGLRKVRNEQGRLVTFEPDPRDAPLARERIDWFLSGKGLIGTCRLIAEHHPQDTWMQPGQLKRWLKNPSLTGRICWHKQGNSGDFAHVAPVPTFQGLINDAEHQQLLTLVDALSIKRAAAGRPIRTLSGLCRCQDCDGSLSHKLSGQRTWYLRCSNPYCKYRTKAIRVDKVLRVLKAAVAFHAVKIAPLLSQPEVEPPEVMQLRAEIKTLRQITGADALIQQKEAEIERYLKRSNRNSEQMLLASMLDYQFWDQSEEELNSQLRSFVDQISVQLAPVVKDSTVAAITMKTPSARMALLPKDQDSIYLGIPSLAVETTTGETVQWKLPDLIREIQRRSDELNGLTPDALKAMSAQQREEVRNQLEASALLRFSPKPKRGFQEVIWEAS